MAQYTKATNFAAKDALLPSDPDKIIKGAEFDDEFNAIQTAVNSKSNLISPSFTGTPLAPTATLGTNTTQVATTAFVDASFAKVLVSQDVADASFDVVEETGGSKDIATATHTHSVTATTGTDSLTTGTATVATGGVNTNVQPYVVVKMWKRTV